MAEQKISKKRRATEAQIIDAFDRLVRREGLRNVRVNHVVDEAGVGKGLLYAYFGGLPGLVKAWGQKEKIWPDSDHILDLSDEEKSRVDLTAQIKTIVTQHATDLRDEPLRTELLADELMNPTAISDALSEVRRQLAKEHKAIFAHNSAFEDEDAHALLTVMMSAATYIAMRAVKAPNYMGIDLSTEKGWQDFSNRMVRVVENAMVGAKARTSDETREQDAVVEAPHDLS